MRHYSRAWLASLFFAAFSAQAVPRLYDEIASKHALSGEELYAYAVAQTGRVNEYRRVIPWPWTVMVNGYRYQFKTRLDLFNYLHNAQTGTAFDIRFGIDSRKLGSQNREQLWQELDVSAMLQRTALRLGGKSAPEMLRMDVMPVLTAGSVSRAEIDALIEKVSREVGIDPLLLHAVTRKESAYKVKATSHKGAMGLMQLMPDTAASLGLAPEQYYDPYANLWGGATYLKKQLDTFGSLELALAAYNAGPGRVRQYGYQIPPFSETRDYVATITARYAKARSLAGQIPAPVPVIPAIQAEAKEEGYTIKPALFRVERDGDVPVALLGTNTTVRRF